MTVSPWSPLVTALLGGFLTLYLVAFGMFHLMVFRVNRGLTDAQRSRTRYIGVGGIGSAIRTKASTRGARFIPSPMY